MEVTVIEQPLALTVCYVGDRFTKYLTIYNKSSKQFEKRASQRPHWLQWDAPNSPSKLPLPFDDHHPIKYTPLTTSNGILIQSAVLPQYTFRTHTDR